jgi:hypothetical protein
LRFGGTGGQELPELLCSVAPLSHQRLTVVPPAPAEKSRNQHPAIPRPNEPIKAPADPSVAQWHEKVLAEALKWRESHPDFTFSLRTLDVTSQERLNRGYWFPGSNRYLFSRPFRVNDPNNKTKSIGFVIVFGKDGQPRRSYLEIGVPTAFTRSVCRTHLRSVSAEQPNFSAIDWIAASVHFLSESPRVLSSLRKEDNRTAAEVS